jgi:small subunit ribosomal protein S21
MGEDSAFGGAQSFEIAPRCDKLYCSMRLQARSCGHHPGRKRDVALSGNARAPAERRPGTGETRTWERRQSVTEIIIREGESFETALKKFTRRVQQAGLLSEAKRRQHYEPPSVKRKRKADARERKARKARMKAAAMGF